MSRQASPAEHYGSIAPAGATSGRPCTSARGEPASWVAHALQAKSAVWSCTITQLCSSQKDRVAPTGRSGLQVQLDGSVRRSGVGTPPWDRWLDDIPTVDSVQTRLTDGIGSSK